MAGSVAFFRKECGSKPPSTSMSDLERQQTDAALLTLARVLATIAAARTKAARIGGTHAA
jgi:hypothetical protein